GTLDGRTDRSDALWPARRVAALTRSKRAATDLWPAVFPLFLSGSGRCRLRCVHGSVTHRQAWSSRSSRSKAWAAWSVRLSTGLGMQTGLLARLGDLAALREALNSNGLSGAPART